jgi:hypothetical protein
MKRCAIVVLAFTAVILMTSAAAMADCPDGHIVCIQLSNGKIYDEKGQAHSAGAFVAGNCWGWGLWGGRRFGCNYCSSWPDLARQCTEKFPGPCANGACAACTPYSDTAGIAGPCYDVTGKQLMYNQTSF